MIDTIVLTLPIFHFRITKSDLFQPDARGMNNPPYIAQVNGVRKCVQNPTKEDEKKGIYKPRLTYIRRWDWIKEHYSLKIEFSIPKLIFWNNFDELSDSDFPFVISKLKEVLFKMWIQVVNWKLEKAIVSTIHYGKNIILDDYTSVNRVLQSISKTNISQRFDVWESQYQNGWWLLRLHTKSFQIVFYDKIADLKKSKHRAIEKEMRKINYQMSLFDTISKTQNKQKNQSFDVLRLEIRFMNKVKLKSVFKSNKIFFDDPFTFRDAFNMENARRILEYHWKIIAQELKTIEFFEMKSIDRWSMILQQPVQVTPTKALALAMLSELIGNNDYRTIRNQFEARYNKRSLSRMYKELQAFEWIKTSFTFIPIINKALNEYKPLQIKEYM